MIVWEPPFSAEVVHVACWEGTGSVTLLQSVPETESEKVTVAGVAGYPSVVPPLRAPSAEIGRAHV